jgi:diketogulonate reductase-like aldo/keto reductase
MEGVVRMKFVTLPAGERVPAFGQGTWYLAENPAARAEEIATLRLGFDLGARLVDTAEMYGEGLAEELVGEAIAGRRDDIFLVSKVYPHNATRSGVPLACERSLRRLRTDRIDLYLLHWRGAVPLTETMDAFMALQAAGKIRYYGVSNLDIDDMQQLWTASGGRDVQTDQVLYNLVRRGVEWDLLPWLRERRIPVMAYSPVERKALVEHPRLRAFARRHNMTPAQVAIAWLFRNDDIIVIPKTSNRQHLRENVHALDIRLTAEQLTGLDALFQPPDGPSPLEML